MTTPDRRVIQFTGPCPRCGTPATWFQHISEPFPTCACTHCPAAEVHANTKEAS